MFHLKGTKYVQQLHSSIFPKAAASRLTEFIRASQELERPVWMKNVGEWIRAGCK
jgi:hypothetical protein